MNSFEVFFEKLKNPLRKKSLEGEPTNFDMYQREKDTLSPENQEKLQRQVDLQVPQDRIDAWRTSKLKETEQQARNVWLRDKLPTSNFEKVFERNGVQFFVPKNERFLQTPRKLSVIREIQSSANQFISYIKDLLPNRKPRIVIKDLGEDKSVSPKSAYGEGDAKTAAYFRDGIIYVDIDEIWNYKYLVHEYAHYLAEKAPKDAQAIIEREYKQMLDNYFRSVKKKQRVNLENPNDERLRQKIAKKLGLPSDYSLTNPDEFWAEIITYWKDVPNNVNTYRFKKAVKQIISRL